MPPPVVFLCNSKNNGFRLQKISDFSFLPIALPFGLKPGFYTNCLSPEAHGQNDYFLHKETDCRSFSKKFCKLFAYNPWKEIFTFFIFLNQTSAYIKFCNIFLAYLKWHSQGLFKSVYLSFFSKHFYYNFTLHMENTVLIMPRKVFIFENFFICSYKHEMRKSVSQRNCKWK